MDSKNKIARAAGLLYLTCFMSVILAELIRSNIIVSGDAAATAGNIMASESLFRIAFVSDMMMIISGLFVALALYTLLNAVNKDLASLMVIFTLASVAITGVNMLNLFAPVLLLSGAGYPAAFETDHLNALAMLFLDLHKYGYFIANIFFGLWLLPLGFLVVRSGYFPKILGILLIIACFGYLIDFFVIFLFPGFEAVAHPVAMAPAAIAELSFALWLLIKGVRIQ